MTNLEIYYRNVTSILESRLIELEEVAFDVEFQLNDEYMASYKDDKWRSRARFKLRKTKSDAAKVKKAIKSQNRKITIVNQFINQIEGAVNLKSSACVAYVEHEVMVQVLKAKLKKEMGMDAYIEYMKSEIDSVQNEIRKNAAAHLIKTNRMPAAIDIYNWKEQL